MDFRKSIKKKQEQNTQKNNGEKLSKHCRDIESRKSRFSWKLITGFHVPYLICLINGEYLRFVSTRMAETHLLSKYLHYLHSDIYTSCTSVKCYFITDSEAKLLNDINHNHTNCVYGKEMFYAGKDFIASLEDVIEFYTFIKVCYNKLLRNITPDHNEVCGFIRINSESIVPYCVKDGQKYVPLFFFERVAKSLRNQAIKLENWNLAYLKFCCKVLGIRNELFAIDSCSVTRLDDIKKYYPPDTYFEEYWPAKIVYTSTLTNQKSTRVSPSSAWIRAESTPAENTISRTLTAPVPVIPQSMPVIMNTYQIGWPPNQMGSTMSQGNSSINGMGHVPPPLDLIGSTAPVIGQRVIHNSQAQQQLQQQQQIRTTPQTQQSYSDRSVGGFTNTQQRNALRNVRPIVTTPATEIVDLSTPPSSPIPSSVPETSLLPNVGWELMKMPERMCLRDSSIIAAYKIQKMRLQGQTIHCINAKPYIYSDLMVTLEELVQMVLPSCSIARCAHILKTYLKTTLYSGNSKQLVLLQNNGRIKSINPEDTPMAMLRDIAKVFSQLRTLMSKSDDQIQQLYQYVSVPK